jgi:hypothetical protein
VLKMAYIEDEQDYYDDDEIDFELRNSMSSLPSNLPASNSKLK